MRVVTHRRDRQVHLPLVCLRTGGYRVEPRRQRPQHPDQLPGSQIPDRKIREQIHDLTPPDVVLELLLVISVEQLRQLLRSRPLLPALGHLAREGGDVVVRHQRFAQRLRTRHPGLHQFIACQASRLQERLHHIFRIGRGNRQRIPGLIHQSRPLETQLKVPGLLPRTPSAQENFLQQLRWKRILLSILHRGSDWFTLRI